ncbi:MAG: hypothetical protein LH702_21400 [Phormidesmis sp. CAN_BIN44]|nr:hypothetical protein [Phormidesmis sp. CAN_BIN44]
MSTGFKTRCSTKFILLLLLSTLGACSLTAQPKAESAPTAQTSSIPSPSDTPIANVTAQTPAPEPSEPEQTNTTAQNNESNLVGSWTGSYTYKGESYDCSYTFNQDGTVSGQTRDRLGETILESTGRYSYSNDQITIDWQNGYQETATLTWTNDRGLEYAIVSPKDKTHIVAQISFKPTETFTSSSENGTPSESEQQPEESLDNERTESAYRDNVGSDLVQQQEYQRQQALMQQQQKAFIQQQQQISQQQYQQFEQQHRDWEQGRR